MEEMHLIDAQNVLANRVLRNDLFAPWKTIVMPIPPHVRPSLKPYSEVRRIFSEMRLAQLRTQGPVTEAEIRRIQQSRKYAHSPVSATKRA